MDMKELSQKKCLFLSDSIAEKYHVKLAIELLFDYEFSFSDSEISE